MILVGGLLSLYWDSGVTVPPPDELPLGVENTARPNVRVRGLPPPPASRQPRPAPAPRPATPVEEPAGEPVPLPVLLRAPVLRPSATVAHARLRRSGATLTTARAAARAAAADGTVVPAPQARLQVLKAEFVPTTPILQYDAARGREAQRRRNAKKAAILAAILADE